MLVIKARVREQLKAQERSQAWLARRLDMNETLLAHYLSERRPSPPDLLDRIAAVLGCSVNDLRPVEEEAA